MLLLHIFYLKRNLSEHTFDYRILEIIWKMLHTLLILINIYSTLCFYVENYDSRITLWNEHFRMELIDEWSRIPIT